MTKTTKEMLENKIELLLEDLEFVHRHLDRRSIPRETDRRIKYSLVGRIKILEESFQKQLSELEDECLNLKNEFLDLNFSLE